MGKELFKTTIYMVPGPSVSAKYLHGNSVPGGWGYAIENLKHLDQLNPEGISEVVIGILDSWGDHPQLPHVKNFSIKVENVSGVGFRSKDQLSPSHQHADVLNSLLKIAPPRTRFYAILDPDCYLVYPSAIKKVSEHMDSHGLAAFGVPYPPKRFNHQNSPAVFFTIFDQDKFRVGWCDFSPPPDISRFEGANSQKNDGSVLRRVRTTFLDFVRGVLVFGAKFSTLSGVLFGVLEQLRFSIPSRNFYSLQLDTGWKIFEKLSDTNLAFEVAKNLVEGFDWQIGFNERSYLESNPDVARSSNSPSWHFLLFGVFQNRSFGKQNFFWRGYIKLLKPRHGIQAGIFDASSVEAGRRLVRVEEADFWRNFLFSDQYNWHNKVFAVHLSSYGKNADGLDAIRIENLFSTMS